MTGFELAVKFKAHSTFKKAMDVFSTRTQRSFESLRFHYDGERVHSDSTPAGVSLHNVTLEAMCHDVATDPDLCSTTWRMEISLRCSPNNLGAEWMGSVERC